MFEHWYLRSVGAVFLLMAGLSHAETTLNASPFAVSLSQALHRADTLRSYAPSLADALEGKDTAAGSAQAALAGIPADRPSVVALGQIAEAVLQERQVPSSGLPLLSMAMRNADFGNSWLAVLAMEKAGSAAGVSLASQGLETSMLAQGWQRLPEAASWLLSLASENSDAMADTLYRSAERIDPVSPVPAMALGRHCSAHFKFFNAFDAYYQALLRLKAYPQNQLVAALNGVRMFRTVGLICAFLILIGWLARYWPWISHRWAEHLPQGTSIYLRYAVCAAVLVCLLLIGVGAYLVFFAGAFLVWRHLKRGGRVYLSLLVLFIGAQGFFAAFENALAASFDLQSPESFTLRAIEEGPSAGLRQDMRGSGALLAQSLLQFKQGNITALPAGLSAGDVQEQILAGNAAFAQGRYDLAGAAYDRARAADSQNPVLPFNRSQVAAYTGHTDSLNAFLKQADIAGVTRFNLQVSQNSRLFQNLPPNRLILPPELSPQLVWARLGTQLSNPAFWLSPKGSAGFLEIPYAFLFWVAVALLICLMVLGRRRNQARELFRCKTCGRVMCRHCRRGLHCMPCFRRLSAVNELDLRNELLLRLEREGVQRDHFLSRLLDLLLPGVGAFSRRSGFLSLLRLVLLAVAFSIIFDLPAFLSHYPYAQSANGFLPCFALLVILYGFSLYFFLRPERRAIAKD